MISHTERHRKDIQIQMMLLIHSIPKIIPNVNIAKLRYLRMREVNNIVFLLT